MLVLSLYSFPSTSLLPFFLSPPHSSFMLYLLFYNLSLIFIHFGLFLSSLFSVSHSTPVRRLSPPPHVDVSCACARSAIIFLTQSPRRLRSPVNLSSSSFLRSDFPFIFFFYLAISLKYVDAFQVIHVEIVLLIGARAFALFTESYFPSLCSVVMFVVAHIFKNISPSH